MKENKKPCELAKSIIENKANKFTEDDREWLEKMEEEKLNILAAAFTDKEPEPVENQEKEKETETEDKTKVKVSVQSSENGKIEKVSKEELEKTIQEILSNEENPEKFIDKFFPDSLKGQFKNGLNMYKKKREELIEGIIKNNSKWDKEALETWNDDNLEKLYNSVVPEGDYSLTTAGNRSSIANSTDEDEVDSMIIQNRGSKKEETTKK